MSEIMHPEAQMNPEFLELLANLKKDIEQSDDQSRPAAQATPIKEVD